MHVVLVIMCNKSHAATIILPVCNSKVKSIMIFVICMIFHNLNGAFFFTHFVMTFVSVFMMCYDNGPDVRLRLRIGKGM